MKKKEWIQQAILPTDNLVNIHETLDFLEERLVRVNLIADKLEKLDSSFFDPDTSGCN